MRIIKKISQNGLLVLCLLLLTRTANSQAISDHFFGENAWMPDTIGNAGACPEPPCVLYGKLHKYWGDVKKSKASLIRFGGIAPDKNIPTNYQYIKMIDSIRGKGMEPIIQVPFRMGRYTAQQAADIVKYINITRGKKIKYWIIGNEPDLSYSYTSAAQVAAYFKPFASAMKAVDPAILIIGPECAWYNKAIIDGLTTPNGPSDITGKDLSGRYYVDIISFHTYPFNGSQSRIQVISKLISPGSMQDNLVALNARINACNTAHGRTGTNALKTAITEANINWQNSSSDDLYGNGANSFIGGQFIAEMIGVGLKNNLDFINFWSVVEGNSTALNIGFIDPSSGNKKPSFYHFQLLAEKMKGSYLNGVTNQINVKSFGSQDGQKISVVILNEDISNNYNYTVRLNSAAITGSNPLKININAGVANEYTDMVPSQSSVVLTFNAAGTIIEKCEYSLYGHAVANLPPHCTPYVTTAVTTPVNPEIIAWEIKAFPNPSDGKFSIQLNSDNPEEKTFEVELINLLGQRVYSKNCAFLKGKEAIELDEAIANGLYIVQVKEGDIVKTQKLLLQK